MDLEDIVVGVVSGIGRFLLWCWWVVPGPVGSPPYPSSRHRAVRWLQVIDYLLWRFFLAGLLIGVTVLILKLPG